MEEIKFEDTGDEVQGTGHILEEPSLEKDVGMEELEFEDPENDFQVTGMEDTQLDFKLEELEFEEDVEDDFEGSGYPEEIEVMNALNMTLPSENSATISIWSKLHPMIKDSEDMFGDDCSICLNPIPVCDVVGIMPCDHYFHGQCIKCWVQVHENCPLCVIDYNS